jgi:hypothetical protein
MRDAFFTDYIHRLSRYDYSIWKPIKNKRKPNIASPPIVIAALFLVSESPF